MIDSIPTIEPHVPGRVGRDGMLLRAPYREGLVRALKTRLPPTDRYWDEGIGAWWIDARAGACAEAIVLCYFPSLLVLGDGGEEDRLLHPEGSGGTFERRSSVTREAP